MPVPITDCRFARHFYTVSGFNADVFMFHLENFMVCASGCGIYTRFKYMSLHPHNLAQKTEVIIEHFRSQVQHLIGGNAKAMNTKGNALLSGNVFCGHCEARLTLTTNGKKYLRKDGEVTVTPRTRYVCYNKTRHPENCDRQTGYTTSKLDGVVEKLVESIFSKIKEQPGDQIIAAQFEERIAGIKLNLEQARAALNSELQVLSMLEGELLKVIQGTSALKPEMLNKKHDEAERAVADKRLIVETLEQELANSKDTKRQVTRQYNDVLTWADMYAESAMEVKKMIVAQLIGAVRVSADYKIEIDFKISERQLGLDQEYQAEKKPKQKKRRGDPAL